MPACIIADIAVKDAEAYEGYTDRTPEPVEKYGGKFIGRGGTLEPLEGGWQPDRLVVAEFPTCEQAQKFCYSDEYEPLKAVRERTTDSKVILVDGA